jgi:hypothetical protein
MRSDYSLRASAYHGKWYAAQHSIDRLNTVGITLGYQMCEELTMFNKVRLVICHIKKERTSALNRRFEPI